MENKVISFLELNTDPDNPWYNINDIMNELYPNLINDKNSVKLFLKLGKALYNLTISQTIRVQYDQNIDSDNKTKVALESNITKIKNRLKDSALEEMNENLNKAVKKEDYETACVYRDMIEKYS